MTAKSIACEKRTTRGWPPERRRAQAERIRHQKPWLKATGPRTAAGKAKVAQNAYKHGRRSAAFLRAYRELSTLLRHLKHRRGTMPSAPLSAPFSAPHTPTHKKPRDIARPRFQNSVMHNIAEQIPLDLGARTAMRREDFLVGPSNQSAVDWIESWPNWSAPFLVLSGPAACGKTHLASIWQAHTDAQIIRPEMLLSRTAQQIADSGETILIDGVDPWLGTREAEETLFHLYNIFKEERRTALLTSRAAPAHVEFTIPDLASRLRAAPCASIMSPDETLLQNIIVKMFADRQIEITQDTLKYLIPRMERSFDAAKNIVEKSDKLALAQKRAVSIPLLREVLISA